MIGYNMSCGIVVQAPIMLDADASVYTGLYRTYAVSLGLNIDRVAHKLAKAEYMPLTDVTLSWLAACCGTAMVTALLPMHGVMPNVVCTFIMTENIMCCWTSLALFFWFSFTVVRMFSTTPSLMFNVRRLAIYVLLVHIDETVTTQACQSPGERREGSVRSGAPSHLQAGGWAGG